MCETAGRRVNFPVLLFHNPTERYVLVLEAGLNLKKLLLFTSLSLPLYIVFSSFNYSISLSSWYSNTYFYPIFFAFLRAAFSFLNSLFSPSFSLTQVCAIYASSSSSSKQFTSHVAFVSCKWSVIFLPFSAALPVPRVPPHPVLLKSVCLKKFLHVVCLFLPAACQKMS